ncbi:MAG: dihydropteroate synthase [Calditrichia bacterium]
MLIIDRPLIMGILNVTPDSFSDGGQFFDPEAALRHAMEMTEAGADIIDIGAESTRPGAGAVAMEEEWQRVEPVLRGLRKSIGKPVSIDTHKAEIARRSVAEGADIINDISGLTFDPEMAEVAAEADVPVVIMHIKGTPRDMQKHPTYENLMEEITAFFERQTKYAISSGIAKIILDPGLGFGKRFEDNYELIRRLGEFRAFGFPLLAGPSRKSFIGRVAGNTPLDKMLGTGAACAMAVSNGGHILRVHDVDEIQRIVKVSEAVRKNKA